MIRNNVHHLPVLEGGRLRGVRHEPRPDDAPGGLADLGRPRDRGPAGPGRACRAARTVDGMISVLLEEGARRRQPHPRDHRDQRPAGAQGARPGRRAGRAGARPLVLDRLRQRGAARADFQDRPGQRDRLRRPGRTRRSRARARAWFAALHAPGARRARALRLPALPRGLHGREPGVVPAAARVEAHLLGLGRQPRRRGGAALADPLRLPPAARRGRDSPCSCARTWRPRSRRAPAFLGFLANQIVKNPPPLGFLHRFVVEKEGEHKDRLNLKLKAIAPIVDLARLFALEKGLGGDRHARAPARACANQNTIVGRYGEELEQAFEFLMLLRIHHQQRRWPPGRSPTTSSTRTS